MQSSDHDSSRGEPAPQNSHQVSEGKARELIEFLCLVTSEGTDKSGGQTRVYCGPRWLWDYRRIFRWRSSVGGWTRTQEKTRPWESYLQMSERNLWEWRNLSNKVEHPEMRSNIIFLKRHTYFFFFFPSHAKKIKALLPAYYVCGWELAVDNNLGRLCQWELGEAEYKCSRMSHLWFSQSMCSNLGSSWIPVGASCCC